MPGSTPIKILVAPLDWGLGHTTRCMPVIQKLLEKGVEVVLAGNTAQQKVLSAEFPNCTFLPLEGYNITYSGKREYFVPKMVSQLPRLLQASRRENRWLKTAVRAHRLSGVISDNRFGLYHEQIPSLFITHQLHICTGAGKWVDALVRRMNYHRIQKFSRCWIPDFKDTPNLAGQLSHPRQLPPVHCSYIGPLTRMTGHRTAIPNDELLFIISGPEPQRSVFENKIFDQLSTGSYKATVVRGLPAQVELRQLKGATVYNHLPATALAKKVANARLVICRSGYSSVMDINAVGAKSLFIPTPGQAEQEYLGHYLMEKGFALKCEQDDFDLEKMLNSSLSYSYDGFIPMQENLLDDAISQFIQDCETKIHHPV